LVGVVHDAADAMAAGVAGAGLAGMDVVVRGGVLLLVMVRCAFEQGTQDHAGDQCAGIVAAMVILAGIGIRGPGRAMVVAARVGEHAGTAVGHPDPAGPGIEAPGPVEDARALRALVDQLRRLQRRVAFVVLVVVRDALDGGAVRGDGLAWGSRQAGGQQECGGEHSGLHGLLLGRSPWAWGRAGAAWRSRWFTGRPSVAGANRTAGRTTRC